MPVSFLPALPGLVSRRLADTYEQHTAALRDLGDGAGDILDAGLSLLSGGKRLRAAFCAAGWNVVRPAELDETSPAVVAGSALELFQGAALVHDDLIDASDTRRGMPAAHRRLAAHHAAAGWLGSSDAHGAAGAILLGDLMLTLAAREMDLARERVETGAAGRAGTHWSYMMSEVAVGQYLDVRSQALPFSQSSVAASLQVVEAKSARYSVEHPIVIGAALAGAPQQTLEHLSRIGLPLGIAFQLRDDALGVTGDPQLTGKPAGDDLREGKRTVLLALTMRRTDDAGRDLLRRRVGRGDLRESDVLDIQHLMRSTGALDEHEELIAHYREQGLGQLAALDIPADRRLPLAELAEAVTARQT